VTSTAAVKRTIEEAEKEEKIDLKEELCLGVSETKENRRTFKGLKKRKRP
jgi:hypothetical protein